MLSVICNGKQEWYVLAFSGASHIKSSFWLITFLFSSSYQIPNFNFALSIFITYLTFPMWVTDTLLCSPPWFSNKVINVHLSFNFGVFGYHNLLLSFFLLVFFGSHSSHFKQRALLTTSCPRIMVACLQVGFVYTAKFPVLFACLQVSNFSFSTSSSSLSLFVFRTVFFRLSHVPGMTGYFQIITFIRQALPASPVDTSSAICNLLLAWCSRCWWDIQIVFLLPSGNRGADHTKCLCYFFCCHSLLQAPFHFLFIVFPGIMVISRFQVVLL